MLFSGSVVDRMPGPKYLAELRFAELALRAPLPRAATLRRMRGEVTGELLLALRAPQSTLVSARGPLRFDETLEQSFAWLLAARDALAAKLLILPTPADLTPGVRDRELLAQLAARLPRAVGCHYVWAPSGPWEPEQAEQVARELGLALAFDPLYQPKPAGPVAYARLRALGAQQSFSDALLEDVHTLLETEPAAESFVSFDSSRSFSDALRLQKLVGADHDAA